MSNWASNPPVPQPGSNAGYGAGSAQAIRFRDPLDARRSMVGQTPDAQYPDGYLGTIQSRREDRLLKNLQNRLTNRSYQRGVHKGEKIDPSDYFWPADFNDKTGLLYEEAGMHWTASGSPLEHLVNGGKPGPQDMARLRGQYGIVDKAPNSVVDPARQATLKAMLRSRETIPPWQ